MDNFFIGTLGSVQVSRAIKSQLLLLINAKTVDRRQECNGIGQKNEGL